MLIESFLNLIDNEVTYCHSPKNKKEDVLKKKILKKLNVNYIFYIYENYMFICPYEKSKSFLITSSKDNMDVFLESRPMKKYELLENYEPWIGFDKTYLIEKWFPRFMHDKVLISSLHHDVYGTYENVKKLIEILNIDHDILEV